MSKIVTFDCPSCGAPVKTPQDALALECDYCGNNIMVPENLRPAQPSHFGTTIVMGPPTFHPQRTALPLPDPESARTRRRGAFWGCMLLTFLIVVSVVPALIGIGAGLSAVDPGLLGGIMGSGFAEKTLSFGGKGRGPGLFEAGTDIASDGAGDIYVVERTTGRVQRFDRLGRYLNGWVVEGAQPSALAIDREAGEIYVVDSDEVYIYEVATGNPIATFSQDPLGFFGSTDIAVFPNGDLLAYVSGGSSDDLLRLDTNGQEINRFAKVISAISGERGTAPAPWNVRLAVDGSDRMLVLNTSGAEVFIFGPDGKYIRRFGGEESGISFATDIAVDSKGSIYVSHFRGVEVYDSTGRALGQVSTGSVAAIEVTADDDLLAFLNSQEVAKFTLREK